jgi:DNA-binding phage protein
MFFRSSESPLNIVLLGVTFIDYPDLDNELRRLANCCLRETRDADECLEFLTSDKWFGDEVYLIISDQFVEDTRTMLFELVPQIKRAYIIEPPCEKELVLISGSKLRGPFRYAQLLISTLIDDREKTQERTSQCLAIEDDRFVLSQFFFNILSRVELDPFAIDEFVAKARERYMDRSIEALQIDEFHGNYNRNHVVERYTRDSFFHRFLNESLRTSNINHVFSCRSIIQDLAIELKKMQKSSTYIPSRLFRGQLVDIDEIHIWKNNIGRVFSMNSFWSTTHPCRKKLSELFSGCGQTANDPRHQSVVFLITVGQEHLKTAIHADTGIPSEEDEHLFSLRSLFRVDCVRNKNNMWYVDLTLVDQDCEQVRQLIKSWESILGEHALSMSYYEAPVIYFTHFGFRLLLHMILQLEKTAFAKDEMMQMIRTRCGSDSKLSNQIDKFRSTYDTRKAIYWYTADSFFYRFMTKCLINHDIDGIFKLRYFICDMRDQMTQISQTAPLRPTKLYRGKVMHRNRFEHILRNIGRKVSFNNFVSTTSDNEVASVFAGRDMDVPPDYTSVIFDIQVKPTESCSTLMTDVGKYSGYGEEKESIFFAGSTFRLTSAEKLDNDSWLVKMEPSRLDDEEQWNILTKNF